VHGLRAAQVLLSAARLPRPASSADVVGAVLLDVERGQGAAKAAGAHQVPVSTARCWVTAVTRAATTLTAAAVQVAAAFGDTAGCWPASARPRGTAG
jgi:mannose/fructose/N-acetylgalactosamine-specific phosphotransferase system component IIC